MVAKAIWRILACRIKPRDAYRRARRRAAAGFFAGNGWCASGRNQQIRVLVVAGFMVGRQAQEAVKGGAGSVLAPLRVTAAEVIGSARDAGKSAAASYCPRILAF